MAYLLNLVYLALLVALSPWIIWRSVRTGRYREGLAAKFWGLVPCRISQRPAVWLHAVSVGEVNLLKPLLAEIARRRPDWECVISTTTQTGYALARSRYPNHLVFYCPLDFSWAVRAAMRRIAPTLLVLAELELWPNLIAAARERGTRVAIVNGRLSDHSFRGYLRLRSLVGRLLRQIDCIAVQNEQYADRFRRLGASDRAVRVTGSMKFDGAQTDRGNPTTVSLASLAGITADDIVFLAGSTQEPEERLAVETFRALSSAYPRLRLIVVPRHAERFDVVADELAASGLPWQRRNALERDGADPRTRILLVDRIGELGAWWGATHIAFVGGSLGSRGGQNMIEPAAYGAAVSFGPCTRNFRDIVALLLEHDSAVVVPDGPALTAFVQQALADPAWAQMLGARARTVVMTQLGATGRTVDLLESLVCDLALPAARAAA